MDIIIGFIILSIIVEYLTSIITPLIKADSDYPIALAISLALGIALATVTGVDLLEGLGFATRVPVVGWIVTGIATGGGSKTAHELVAKLRASRDDIG